MDAIDLIDRLPYEFAARLEADEYFSDIPVIIAEDGNVEAELARKTAQLKSKGGKRGVAVIVLPTLADDEHPNIEFGPLTYYPAFQVVENVGLNRDANGTKKPARRVARRIVKVVKSAGMSLLVADLRPDRPCIESTEVDGLKVVQVNFRCLEVVENQETKVDAPKFTGDTANGTLSITCPTEGATIFYTLDWSYPRPSNDQALEFVQPIQIPATGMLIRACAYKAGSIASWVAAARVTIS